MKNKNAQSIIGIAHEYANPELIRFEEGAFERAMSAKHSLSDWDNIQEEEPDEWDIEMLEAIKNDPDCHSFTDEKDIDWSKHLPNAETIEAMTELDNGKGFLFSGNTEDLFTELDKEDLNNESR